MTSADTRAAPGSDFRAVGERIASLLDASASGGRMAQERAEELVRLVADLYGAGLERLLSILYECGRLDDDALGALAADDLVSSLLLVHDLHPYDLTTRVEHALTSVRPYLASHGGNVEIVSINEDTVHLRLLGSCDGCPSSAVTLKLAVEQAIQTAAPEIASIQTTTPTGARQHTGVIAVESLWSKLSEQPQVTGPGATGEWTAVPEVAGLSDGAVTVLAVRGIAIVTCRVGADRYAFLDRCAACGGSLTGATVGRLLGGGSGDAALRCPKCATHFAVRRAGAAVESPDLHLDPLPLLNIDGNVRVSLPAAVAA